MSTPSPDNPPPRPLSSQPRFSLPRGPHRPIAWDIVAAVVGILTIPLLAVFAIASVLTGAFAEYKPRLTTPAVIEVGWAGLHHLPWIGLGLVLIETALILGIALAAGTYVGRHRKPTPIDEPAEDRKRRRMFRLRTVRYALVFGVGLAVVGVVPLLLGYYAIIDAASSFKK